MEYYKALKINKLEPNIFMKEPNKHNVAGEEQVTEEYIKVKNLSQPRKS